LSLNVKARAMRQFGEESSQGEHDQSNSKKKLRREGEKAGQKMHPLVLEEGGEKQSVPAVGSVNKFKGPLLPEDRAGKAR